MLYHCVCGQNPVHCISSSILPRSISYLHIFWTNFMWRVLRGFFFKILKFVILTFHDDTSSYSLFNISTGFGNKMQFVIFGIFFLNSAFSLNDCGSIKDKFDMLMYPDYLWNWLHPWLLCNQIFLITSYVSWGATLLLYAFFANFHIWRLLALGW